MTSFVQSGCSWMLVDNTNVIYPTNGEGGSTTTQGNSITEATRALKVVAFLITVNTAGAGGTITIYKHDGSTVVHSVVIGAQVVGTSIALGGSYGIQVRPVVVSSVASAGFSAKTSIATLQGYLYYQPVAEMAVASPS